MVLVLLGAVAAALFYIAYEDVKTRLIAVKFLALLVCIRVLLALCVLTTGAEGGAECSVLLPVDISLAALLMGRLSFQALLYSSVCSVVAMSLLKAAEVLTKVCFKQSTCSMVRRGAQQFTQLPAHQPAQQLAQQPVQQLVQQLTHQSIQQPVHQPMLPAAHQPMLPAAHQPMLPAAHQPTPSRKNFLGTGDVLLIGVCCLFLTPSQAMAFLPFSMMLGVALALYYLMRYKDKTFPFAPAIVLAGVIVFWLC